MQYENIFKYALHTLGYTFTIMADNFYTNNYDL